MNWNTKGLLQQCLESLESSRKTLDMQVIVVDNASTDGSPEMVRQDHPGVQVIANSANRGYSAANNQGIRQSDGRYVLLLNSDTEVHPNSLRTLVDYADSHPSAGILGPRLLNSDGTLQPSGGRFPTPIATIAGLAGLDRLAGRPRYGTRRDYSKAALVDEVSGAAMMIRRDVIEQVGLLDEAFAWGYEDVDLCRRAHQAGWQVHYVPAASVTHQWGASRRLAPARTVLMAVDGRRYYFRKHYGRLPSAIVMVATLVSHLLRSAVFGVAGIARPTLRTRSSMEWEIVHGLVDRRA